MAGVLCYRRKFIGLSAEDGDAAARDAYWLRQADRKRGARQHGYADGVSRKNPFVRFQK